MKLHFIGRLESLDVDWARLQKAMEPAARHLSPEERVKLIPDEVGRPDVMLAKVRPGLEHNASHQPDAPNKPFTIEQELDICRRYIQDFVCFSYGIPQSCLQNARAVF